MFEIIRAILTSPLWTIVTTIFLWIILFSVFSYFKLSAKNWRRLEYIWIFIALLGVLVVIEKNNKEFRTVDIINLKQNIKFNLLNINFLLGETQACFKYNKMASSPPDLDDRQFDQDLVCKWARNYNIEIDTLEDIPITLLDTTTIKNILFKTSFMDDYVKQFQNSCSLINADIIKFKDYSNQIKSNQWEDFSKTLGVLLLIFAFAVRLSITTNNVRTTK